MAKKKNQWNLSDMEATLVKDTEARIEEGFATLNTPAAPSAPSGFPAGTSPDEPTKGVQTYVPMSVYRRLMDEKLRRHETIGTLVCEAITFWLDAQA